MVNSYKDLIVWQKSFELAKVVYQVTANFPKSETFCLTSQMHRCGISIPSNIAEGYNRGHRLEYLQFLIIAYGSGAELETQLMLAKELGFISDKDFDYINNILIEVMKMLNRMLSKLDKYNS